MSQRKRVEIGRATDLHFGAGHSRLRPGSSRVGRRLSGGGPASVPPDMGASRATGSHGADSAHRAAATAKAVGASARGVKHVTLRHAPGYRMEGGLSARATKVALGVAVSSVALIAIFGCWWFLWRSVSFTVNDQTVTVRVGSNLVDTLKDGDFYGAKAGRLLSLSGNVLDEAGGTRCTVSIDGKEVPADEAERMDVPEGATVTVSDGVDVTEDHTEETVDAAPTIEMQGTGAVRYVSQQGKAGKKVVWTGETSGEVVDHEVLEEPVNMVVTGRNLKPTDGKKYIALTFDDGPSAHTPQILDILKEKGVKATFYNLGAQAIAYPEYAKRVVAEGHELASHTNKHQYLPKLDRDALREEINSAAENINQATGVKPQMIRAPYGAFDDANWLNAGDLISCNVLWNIDTEDWRRPGAQAITNAVLKGAYNGAIVLMHDGGGDRTQDVEALPGIIDGLRVTGFEPVTVQELMRLDGSIPDDVVNGTAGQ